MTPKSPEQTVLVVEDEHVVRRLIVEVLRELRYVVLEAADGPSGLKIVESNCRIDLMLTDIGLPGLNGRQLAVAARKHRPRLKILFMTGYAENAVLAGEFQKGGMLLMTKPFAMSALGARVGEILTASDSI